jgi:hypothetical protein
MYGYVHYEKSTARCYDLHCDGALQAELADALRARDAALMRASGVETELAVLQQVVPLNVVCCGT